MRRPCLDAEIMGCWPQYENRGQQHYDSALRRRRILRTASGVRPVSRASSATGLLQSKLAQRSSMASCALCTRRLVSGAYRALAADTRVWEHPNCSLITEVGANQSTWSHAYFVEPSGLPVFITPGLEYTILRPC